MRKFRKGLALVLCALMVLTFIPALSISVSAAAGPTAYSRLLADFDGVGGALNNGTIQDGANYYEGYEDGNITVVPLGTWYKTTGFQIPIDWRAGEPGKISFTMWATSDTANEDGVTYSPVETKLTKESGFNYATTSTAYYPFGDLNCAYSNNSYTTIKSEPTEYIYDLIGTNCLEKLDSDNVIFYMKSQGNPCNICIDNIKVYYRAASKMPNVYNNWTPMYDFENDDLSVENNTVTTGTGTNMTYSTTGITAAIVNSDTASEDSTKAVSFKKTSSNDTHAAQYIEIPLDANKKQAVTGIKLKMKTSANNMASIGVKKDGVIYWYSSYNSSNNTITLKTFGTTTWNTRQVEYYTYRAFVNQYDETTGTTESVYTPLYINEENIKDIDAVVVSFASSANQLVYLDDITFNCSHANSTEVSKVEPNCADQGYTVYKCNDCGETFKGDYVAANGHLYGDWIVDTAATCTTDGAQHKLCTVCSDRVDEVIPATGHKMGDWIIDTAATCTAKGTQHRACLNDGCDYVETEEIPMQDHNYGTWIVDKEATCTEAGARHKVCKDCGDVVNEVINPLGHNTIWGNPLDATCTTDGHTATCYCTRCQKVFYEGTVIPATGHSWSQWETTREGNCVITGEKTRTCTTCGEFETEEIVAPGHILGTAVKTAASSFNYGSTITRCTTCDQIVNASYTDMNAISKSITATSVKFTWTKDSTAIKYAVQLYKGGKWTTASSTTGNTATVSGLAQGTKYSFRIYAVDSDGYQTGNIISISIETKITVGKVALSASGATKSAKLSWKKVAKASKYQVYQLSGSKWKLVKTVSTKTATIGKLTKGKKYSFKVRAVAYSASKKAYYGAYSAIKKVTAK